jgi:hypothetical protein
MVVDRRRAIRGRMLGPDTQHHRCLKRRERGAGRADSAGNRAGAKVACQKHHKREQPNEPDTW